MAAATASWNYSTRTSPDPPRSSRTRIVTPLPPACINCELPIPRDARWKMLEVVSRYSGGGDLEVLQSWPLCPDCDTGLSPLDVVEYVRYALS
jgi:hypothetical protein